MEQWSGEQHDFAIKSFNKNNDSFVAAQRSFRVHFNLKRHDSTYKTVPSAKALKMLTINFEKTDSALKKKLARKKNCSYT